MNQNISIITLHTKGLQNTIKRQVETLDNKSRIELYLSTGVTQIDYTSKLKVKGKENLHCPNSKNKETGMTIKISHSMDFKIKKKCYHG